MARAKSPGSGQSQSPWTVEALTCFLALGGEASCHCGALAVSGWADGRARFACRGLELDTCSTEYAALLALAGTHDPGCDGVLR
jgi:hypothetical protein